MKHKNSIGGQGDGDMNRDESYSPRQKNMTAIRSSIKAGFSSPLVKEGSVLNSRVNDSSVTKRARLYLENMNLFKSKINAASPTSKFGNADIITEPSLLQSSNFHDSSML